MMLSLRVIIDSNLDPWSAPAWSLSDLSWTISLTNDRYQKHLQPQRAFLSAAISSSATPISRPQASQRLHSRTTTRMNARM